MCRSIKTLHNFEPPATDDEIRASSLQFVRKLSGFTRPSQSNDVAFNRAVEQVAQAARALGLESRGHRLVTSVLRERLFPVEAQRLENGPVLDREQDGGVVCGKIG